MDAVTSKHDTSILPADIRAETQPNEPRPSRAEAEAAVRILIAYAGDDPAREGLVDTPRRVVAAYDELFGGYHASPVDVLDRTFSEIGTYDDLVLVRDIPFYSHCEHHIMPFVGRAHVAYLPVERAWRRARAKKMPRTTPPTSMASTAKTQSLRRWTWYAL